MQLQNGLSPSVPYFSQNTATTEVNTHSAVQAKADRTRIPMFPIIHKSFGEHSYKCQTVKDNHQQENLSHSQTQRHPWSILRSSGIQPCSAGKPLRPPINPTLLWSNSLTSHLWVSEPSCDSRNNETAPCCSN